MSQLSRIKRIEEVLTPPAEVEYEPYDYFKAIAPLVEGGEAEAYWEAVARGEEVGPPPMAHIPPCRGRRK